MKNPIVVSEIEKVERHYRRAVTRRASTIVAREAGLRKQDAARSGQTCVEQFGAAVWTGSRSALASATTSPASTLGAKVGKATTDAPRSEKIAIADSDLIILGC
jgi:hypothetical protein